jgi:hypothetical protein
MAESMTTRWMDRMHSLIPMTEQEEQIDDILNQYGINRRQHVVFPVDGRTYVVDFYLPDFSVVLECWKSNSRRGIALTWVERNAAYVDLKFRRIKVAYPAVKCFGLVEVPQADIGLVAKYVGVVMEHADGMAYTVDQLGKELGHLAGHGFA